MLTFASSKRVMAAAKSMHQYLSIVRSAFCEQMDDEIAEAALVFLYMRVARDVFSRRFADRLGEVIGSRLKYTTPQQLQQHITRISQRAQHLERAMEEEHDAAADNDAYLHHVRSVIAAIYCEAGFSEGEQKLRVTNSVMPFQNAIRRIKDHLAGIKNQNMFLLQ